MVASALNQKKPVNIEETPQDTTRDLRTNLEDLKNIEASQEQTSRHQTAGLLETAAGAAGQQAETGGHAGRKGQSSLFRELPEAAGETLVSQKAQQDKLNYTGALQEESINQIQQKATLEKYNQETIKRDREVALLNAKAAFDYGMQSKQLVFSHNGAVSDYAFKVMKEDFERGRVTKRELQKIIESSEERMLEYQLKSEKIMAQIESHFTQGMNENNVGDAKQLMEEFQEHQLEVQKAAARAANTASIMGGIFQGAGAVLGGVFGGPAGAAVGSQVGGAVSNIFNRRR